MAKNKRKKQKFMFAQRLTVKSSLLPQEAHLAIRVAAHKAHNHSLLLAPLKAIHTSELNARKLLLQRGKRSKLISPVSIIPTCNNPNLVAPILDPTLEKHTCALYGVTTAISSGRTPDSTSCFTCRRTSAASISLLLLSPCRLPFLGFSLSSSSLRSGKSPP
ncbi:hypothetical protein CI102_11026 [Trichoderma harzianum]|nr:hypothetical protein CI102_11026 [Trichoderma harzianum]